MRTLPAPPTFAALVEGYVTDTATMLAAHPAPWREALVLFAERTLGDEEWAYLSETGAAAWINQTGHWSLVEHTEEHPPIPDPVWGNDLVRALAGEWRGDADAVVLAVHYRRPGPDEPVRHTVAVFEAPLGVAPVPEGDHLALHSGLGIWLLNPRHIEEFLPDA